MSFDSAEKAALWLKENGFWLIFGATAGRPWITVRHRTHRTFAVTGETSEEAILKAAERAAELGPSTL